MKAAAIQMTSGRDVARNLADAGRLIAAAAEQGAELVVLPENFSFLGAEDGERLAVAETPGDGPAQRFLSEQAARRGVWLVGGTVPVLSESGRAASRSLLLNPRGECVAHYDKIHLFDVEIPDAERESYRESATTVPGSQVVVAETDFGRLGMAVCYDLRFPALFHRLSVIGVDVLSLPAAFTVPTGRVHWQPLLQARAIESLSYVIAAGQWGEHAGGRKTWGHSMIVGPWGEVLATLQAGAGVVLAELDMIHLARIRNTFPALGHRREL
jgi:deaminated glutathione amidase